MISNEGKESQFNDFEKFQNLSDSLPYLPHSKKSSDLKLNLQEYLFLLYSVRETIQVLESKSFNLLDALVADNFCQSRAFRVAYTAKKTLLNFSIKKESLLLTIAKIETILSNGWKWFKKNTISFNEMLENGLHIKITEDELFFIHCYLLTLVQSGQVQAIRETVATSNLSQRTDETKLQNIIPASGFKLSSKFFTRMKKLSRKALASASVKYVQELALLSKDSEAIRYVSNVHTLPQSHGLLPCIPIFRASDILFKEAMKSIPLVLWARQFSEKDRLIREICLYYEPSPNGYKERVPTLEDLGKPVIVVQGYAKREITKFPTKQFWRNNLIKNDVITYPLVACAAHRQFPDLFKDPMVENDPKLISYTNKAIELGCTRDKPDGFTISHVYCAKLEDLAPLKYILNHHLSQYHDLYRELAIIQIKNFFEVGTDPDFILEGSLLSFKISGNDECNEIIRQIKCGIFLMIDPKILNFTESMIWVNLEICHKQNVFIDTYKNDNHHPNSIKFLLDHKSYWSFNCSDITNYLISNPAAYENVVMMEHLQEILKENEHSFAVQVGAILGLGKALVIPHLKEKAKEFLLAFALHVNSKYFRHKDLKLLAMRELQPLIKETDVYELFQAISMKDPRLSIKMEAFSHLDQTFDQKEIFNFHIVKIMILKALKQVNIKESKSFLVYILWENRPYSFQIIQKFGEQDFTQQYLQLFKQNQNDSALAVLKFIGLHTSDQNLFTTILVTLFKEVQKQKAEEMETSPYFIKNEIQPLKEVVEELMQNPAAELPKNRLNLLPNSDTLDKNKSIFANLPREKVMRRAEKLRVAILNSIMVSEEEDATDSIQAANNKVFRILAIRSCARFLVYEPEFGVTKEVHEQRRADNEKLASKLVPTLEKLATDEAGDIDIKKEAMRILSLAYPEKFLSYY